MSGRIKTIHLGAGGLALLGAAVLALRNWQRVGEALRLPTVARSAVLLLLVIGGVVATERSAARSGVVFDWTFEGHFEVAPATVQAIAALDAPVRMTIYHDPRDPRSHMSTPVRIISTTANPITVNRLMEIRISSRVKPRCVLIARSVA